MHQLNDSSPEEGQMLNFIVRIVVEQLVVRLVAIVIAAIL
jgi:hypothetical protein